MKVLYSLLLAHSFVDFQDCLGSSSGVSLRKLEEFPNFVALLNQAKQESRDLGDNNNNDGDDDKRKLIFSEDSIITEFFGQVSDIIDTVALDPRFDVYTTGMAAGNAFNARMWKVPTSKDVTVPTYQSDVSLVGCGLFSDVLVPEDDEHFHEVTDIHVDGTLMYARSLSYPHKASQTGEFKENEDAEKVLKMRLFGGDNPNRVLVPWGEDKYSDESLELIVFHGMGQHRITRVRSDDPNAQTPNGPATYAVYLGFADALEVRPGFAKLGADAYFDSNGKILSIVRQGETYTPQGPQGSEPTKKCWKLFGFPVRCEHVPHVFGWRHAKLAFRSTLHGVVTSVDHLFEHHLVAANSMAAATVPELPPNHPLRRLLTPFLFRTENINHQAAFALINEFGLVHRAFPLTKSGIMQLYSTAKAALRFQTIPEKYAQADISGLETTEDGRLALHTDGLDFHAVLGEFVEKYIALYYTTPGACAEDQNLVNWYQRVNRMQPHQDLPSLNCENLVTVLTTFMFAVTAGHTHVGALNAEVEDPCFMPWSFVEGELCGRPRTFYTQAVTFALTSLEMPKLAEDYTHMFEQEEAKQLWREFQAKYIAFGKRVDERNMKRPRPFRSFDINVVEASIGI